MIGHKRIPSREGGVEIVVEELSTRLVKDGYKVDVYNRKGKNVQDKNVDRGKKKIKEYKGVRIITIPTINKKGIDALLYSILATIRALFGNYDIIHFHAEGSCGMLWLPHLFGIRTVVTIHGLDWQRSKWGGLGSRYIKFGEKVAAKENALVGVRRVVHGPDRSCDDVVEDPHPDRLCQHGRRLRVGFRDAAGALCGHSGGAWLPAGGPAAGLWALCAGHAGDQGRHGVDGGVVAQARGRRLPFKEPAAVCRLRAVDGRGLFWL